MSTGRRLSTNRFGRAVRSFGIVALTGSVVACSTGQTQVAPGSPAVVVPRRNGPLGNKIWVRIVAFGSVNKGFDVPAENGQNILDTIQALQPDVIERFITGDPATQNDPVPMNSAGTTTMGFQQYVDAAMAAGAPGAFVTPKFPLANESLPYFTKAAQDVNAMFPSLKAVDLDTYYQSQYTQAEDDSETQAIASYLPTIGWNFSDGAQVTDGVGSYALANVSANTNWTVNAGEIASITSAGIPTVLAAIDYPTALAEFMQLTPDQQASIIQNVQQGQFHPPYYTFVYPVLIYPTLNASGATVAYDASQITTSSTGPFRGMTILQVIERDVACDRQSIAPCPM